MSQPRISAAHTDSRRITAALVKGTGEPFVITDLTLTGPRPDEVLVRVDAVGVCHADTQAQSGALPVPAPMVAGHEGTGIVEEVGSDVRSLKCGDRVILTFDSCGGCDRCRSGIPTQCREFVGRNFTAGTRTDGTARLRFDTTAVNGSFFGQSSFATYALATERNAVAVATQLPPELLAPVGCAIQTGVGTVLDVLAPPAGAPVVVFGAGAVGLSAVMAAVSTGHEVIAVDTRPDRLDLARKLGAAHLVDPGRADAVKAIASILPGGASHVFESSGASAALVSGVEVLAPGGTIAVVGTSAAGITVAIDVVDLVNKSKRIVGVVEGASRPHESIPRLVRMIEDGDLPVHEIVTTFPLKDIAAAIEAAKSGRVVKPVLLPR
ncbi:NAD(P)-dependent alcohol dehydrogenase [Mycobacterium sp. 21AC1]|uniref:NAD(P)-dependent alcohol dehydrogenase n=1 Tax=[Mycobacterium] appelbergii TaxID=2939269 RepID=UPI00293940F7|nr:NAD(P)-dependent alcohol dehydrogenase [Mycobacterium sp. 21AC1]MDV3128634.1 NAD(P)-dependent alcohol dehydrogenase [Mycobacterium sp. 21AC1]